MTMSAPAGTKAHHDASRPLLATQPLASTAASLRHGVPASVPMKLTSTARVPVVIAGGAVTWTRQLSQLLSDTKAGMVMPRITSQMAAPGGQVR